MKSPSPFLALRLELQLAPGALARGLGVSARTWWEAEAGRVADPERILAALLRVGVKPERLSELRVQYLRFRHELAQQAAADLAARLQSGGAV